MMSLFHCPYWCFQSLLSRPVSSVEFCLKKYPPLPCLATQPPRVSLQLAPCPRHFLPVLPPESSGTNFHLQRLPFIPAPLFGNGGGEGTSFFTSLISGGSIVAGVTPTIMSSSSSSSFSPFSCLTTGGMVST